MTRYGLGALAVVLAGAVQAQDLRYLSADGSVFTYERNRHGAVLTSIAPESDLLADRADTSGQFAPGDVLYLGLSCDAYNRRLGDGRWNWTEGGFLVQFGALRVTFPGQVIEVDSANRCKL